MSRGVAGTAGLDLTRKRAGTVLKLSASPVFRTGQRLPHDFWGDLLWQSNSNVVPGTRALLLGRTLCSMAVADLWNHLKDEDGHPGG